MSVKEEGNEKKVPVELGMIGFMMEPVFARDQLWELSKEAMVTFRQDSVPILNIKNLVTPTEEKLNTYVIICGCCQSGDLLLTTNWTSREITSILVVNILTITAENY